jgi:hypothetical protein
VKIVHLIVGSLQFAIGRLNFNNKYSCKLLIEKYELKLQYLTKYYSKCLIKIAPVFSVPENNQD